VAFLTLQTLRGLIGMAHFSGEHGGSHTKGQSGEALSRFRLTLGASSGAGSNYLSVIVREPLLRRKFHPHNQLPRALHRNLSCDLPKN
jgi:hypothetical protein